MSCSVFLSVLSPVHGKEPLPVLDASEVQEVRRELVAIRDKVNILLDAIDGHPKPSSGGEVRTQVGRRAASVTSVTSNSQDTVVKTDTNIKKGKCAVARG